MLDKLTNTQVQEFLNDYEKNSEIVLLESGTEKDELEKIAELRGIRIKGSRDLAIFKTNYAWTNKANSNGAILPEKELLRVLPQLVGKPININHTRDRVVGVYIDYKYISKENKIQAYGIFFKSAFAKEWEKAKELFKNKQLATSFEIWSPMNKRVKHSDGTYELFGLEIAGGALIYMDKDNQPAFKDAHVLALAKKEEESQLELVYASRYNEAEILFAGQIAVEEPKVEAPKVEENIKIKCSNCGEEIDLHKVPEHSQGTLKCPKCFAILNGQTGQMIYPPQIIDFQITCPDCSINKWIILSKNDVNAVLKCGNCSKEYQVSFAEKMNNTEAFGKLKWVYTGYVSCHQCHQSVPVEGISSLNKKDMKCPKCGLSFSYDIYQEAYKKISKIEHYTKEPLKSSVEGGIEVENIEKPVEPKVEETIPQPKVEEPKIQEVVVEQPKVEIPIAEEPKPEIIPPVVEPKVVDPKSVETPTSEETMDIDAIDAIIKEIDESDGLEESKKLTYEQKQNIPDDMFAVVVTVKNKVTGEPRKIRMFPIHDEAHVRNALAYLPQAKETLVKLGISMDSVEKKIMKRAQELKMTTLIERHQKALKKAITKIRTLRKAMKDIKEKTNKSESVLKEEVTNITKQLEESKKKSEEQIEFHKANAKKVYERKQLIGNILTDEELLNEDKFERARVELENAKLKSNKDVSDEFVGSKTKDDSYYAKKRAEVDKIAFGEKINTKR